MSFNFGYEYEGVFGSMWLGVTGWKERKTGIFYDKIVWDTSGKENLIFKVLSSNFVNKKIGVGTLLSCGFIQLDSENLNLIIPIAF